MRFRDLVTALPPLPQLMGARIKLIAGWEGYAVDTNGNVWGCRTTHGIGRIWAIRKLDTTGGYRAIELQVRGRKKRRLVHCLVLEAFVGPPGDGQECCHGNGIRSDNRLENLRWGTSAENAADREKHGTNMKGERNGEAVLTDKDIRLIRTRYVKGSKSRGLKAIAKEFGVVVSTIHTIVTQKAWRHVK